MCPKRAIELEPELEKKRAVLSQKLQSLGSVIVAYSGGVDSSLLAYYARRVLAERARIVIALSPSLAKAELEAARLQAEQFDFDLIEIGTGEVELDQYRRNDGMRCFFCKSTLFEHLSAMKDQLGFDAIAYGANMDDLDDVRPGHQAAAKFGVVAPLLDSGLYKSEIRLLAETAGLPSFDRPQAACLSSRFPRTVYIDPQRLAVVDSAEEAVRALGFRQVRVRYRTGTISGAESGASDGQNLTADFSQSDLTASVEIGADEMALLLADPDKAEAIKTALKRLGFASVTIDPRGYRQGGADKSFDHSQFSQPDSGQPDAGQPDSSPPDSSQLDSSQLDSGETVSSVAVSIGVRHG